MWKEFREFAIKGNVIDLAVGIVIGAAFTAIVNSLVADIITPLIGAIWDADFSNIFVVLRQGVPPGPYQTLADAQAAGAVTWNAGLFLNAILNFLIVALALFFVVRLINRLKREKPPEPVVPVTPPVDPNQKLIDALDRLNNTLEKRAS
ncbi:MAG: large conductance mechanosensitive channel protein MscL [bacterium]|nr:large conductance mechanosensitive channel protein MscL [bacterium]